MPTEVYILPIKKIVLNVLAHHGNKKSSWDKRKEYFATYLIRDDVLRKITQLPTL